MVLHTRYSMLLLITCIFYINMCLCSDGSSDSDDENKLQQALFLVEILKSEYIKALRANYINQETENVTTFEELSTCAMTTESYAQINATSGISKNASVAVYEQYSNDTFQEMWSSDSASVTPTEVKPVSYTSSWQDTLATGPYISSVQPNEQQVQQDYNSYRRKGNYINDGARAVSAAMKLQSPKMYPFRRRSESKLNQSSQEILSTHPKKYLQKNDVMDQIATELINEIKAVRKGSIHKIKELKTNKSIAISGGQDSKAVHLGTIKSVLKTTLKIYLERSTKMVVPLSENNAFCFLSPKSSLCPLNTNE